MKKHIEILQYITLALVGALGIYLTWNLTPWVSGEDERDPQKRDGIVTSVSRDVRLRNARQISWNSLFLNQGVYFGDEIFVGENSQAQIELNKVKLGVLENSLLRIEKKQDSSSIDLTQGSLNLVFPEENAEKFKLDLEEQSLELSGANSEMALSRSKKGSKFRLGLSFTKGKSTVATSGGQTFSNTEGSSVILEKEGDSSKLTAKNFTLALESPENLSTYIYGQKVRFGWKISAPSELEYEMIEVAEDKNFRNIVYTKPVVQGTDFLEWPVPTTSGRMYWRIRVKTNDGIYLTSSTRLLQVVELRPPKIFNPIYDFISPKMWNAKMIFEDFLGASEYLVHVSRDPNFKQSLKEFSFNAPSGHIEMEAGETLYVRVRVKYPNLEALPPWSEPIQLMVPMPPSPPSHFSLKDSSTENERRVKITWPKVEDVSFYRFFVASSLDKSQSVHDFKTNEAELNCSEKDPQVVRVVSHLDEKVHGSLSNPLMIPICPKRLTIETVGMYPGFLPRFKKPLHPMLDIKWQGDDLGAPIVAQVSKSSKFEKAITVQSKEKRLQVPLNDLETVYVRLKQGLHKDKYLITWNAPTKVDRTQIVPLPKPGLRMPASEEIFLQFADQRSEIPLQWNPIETAVGYDLAISTNSDFSKNVFKSFSKTNQFQLTKKWPRGVFYWRVRAVSYFQESAWSDTRTFRVAYSE